jgi:lipoic acid synthetase
MNLKYAVITSVNRDDLDDGGAEHFSDTVKAIKEKAPEVVVEALVPDFLGNKKSIETLLDSNLEVFAQNLETVKRLTKRVRDPRAGYNQTLQVLAYAKKYFPPIITKTSLMFGLGETEKEIFESYTDIKKAGVDVLTLGQYMRPTVNHLPVEKWYSPEEFEYYKNLAIECGFLEVAAGPMVRSSYRADRIAHLISA